MSLQSRIDEWLERHGILGILILMVVAIFALWALVFAKLWALVFAAFGLWALWGKVFG